MNRTVRFVEKSVVVQNTVPIVIGAAAAGVEVLPSALSSNIEYAERTIQNVGGNDCYYAVGVQASAAVYNGKLLGLSADKITFYGGQSVSVYSAAGTTIATLVLVRKDLSQGSGGILPSGF